MSVISKMYMYTWDFIKHKYLKCLLLLRTRKENPKSCFWYININHLLPSLLWARILYYITLKNIQLDLMGYRGGNTTLCWMLQLYYTNTIVALVKFRWVSVLINTSDLFISLDSLRQDYCHHFIITLD